MTYASDGDNVTLCWKIPIEANTAQLKRFTILALKGPVQQEMQKVASAHRDGRFFRTYDKYHDGLYKGRVTVHADLQAGLLFLKISNYTKAMENVYCPLYEGAGINDLLRCQSDALFLRNNVGKFCCNLLLTRQSYNTCKGVWRERGGGGGVYRAVRNSEVTVCSSVGILNSAIPPPCIIHPVLPPTPSPPAL